MCSKKTNHFFYISSAKSTELLHSPPVYEDPDLDAVDHDFYDYAGVSSVPDDDFYYVSWEDPIYDNFYDYTGKWTTTILACLMKKKIVMQFFWARETQ